MDDKKIIELFFARDERALQEFSAKYGALCRNITRNILGNDLDAEECENDTYLSLWQSIPPARPHRLSAYAAKIARNHALRRLEYMNAQKRRAVLLPTEELAELIGRRRGFLISGGEVNTERMSKVLLDEFRGGKLGKFTLEMPEETV